MPDEVLRAARTIAAPIGTIFGALVDPASHADIDGTGWVSDPVDAERLTREGQRFRMAMYHEQHPDKDYEMTNEVVSFDDPHLIVWRPGQPDANGEMQFGGWTWGYELDAIDADTTKVTLIYDWSGASPAVREFIHFPPFGPTHLDDSLEHLETLAAARTA